MPDWKRYGKYYIDQEGVKKYYLGSEAAFRRNRGFINGTFGEERIYREEWLVDLPEDGVANMDGGVMLTTSEILDFAEGTDSTP